MRTAKSCGPDAPVAGVKFLRSTLLGDDGGKKARSRRGEHEISRKTICAGKAGLLPLNLYAHVRFAISTLAHETAGAARTRSSLRPLFFGASEFARLGQMMSRDRGRLFEN
jgi:hypothetical protein